MKKENRAINISKNVRDKIRNYCAENDVFIITVVEGLIHEFLEKKKTTKIKINSNSKEINL